MKFFTIFFLFVTLTFSTLVFADQPNISFRKLEDYPEFNKVLKAMNMNEEHLYSEYRQIYSINSSDCYMRDIQNVLFNLKMEIYYAKKTEGGLDIDRMMSELKILFPDEQVKECSVSEDIFGEPSIERETYHFIALDGRFALEVITERSIVW